MAMLSFYIPRHILGKLPQLCYGSIWLTSGYGHLTLKTPLCWELFNCTKCDHRLQCRRPRFDPWVGKIPWRIEGLPTAVFLPEKSRGQSSLVGYSPWGRKALEKTKRLSIRILLDNSVIYCF